METGIIELCGGKRCCPRVEVGEREVRIGEPGNLCVLTRSQWDLLVEKVRGNEA
jgi:hypothetical protein